MQKSDASQSWLRRICEPEVSQVIFYAMTSSVLIVSPKLLLGKCGPIYARKASKKSMVFCCLLIPSFYGLCLQKLPRERFTKERQTKQTVISFPKTQVRPLRAKQTFQSLGISSIKCKVYGQILPSKSFSYRPNKTCDPSQQDLLLLKTLVF